MALPNNFTESLGGIPLHDVLESIEAGELNSTPTDDFVHLCWKDEVKPSVLFCYLWARFGPPNGVQDLLRKDDSDNLIHWEWVLSVAEGGKILIQGMNLRTEVWLLGIPGVEHEDSDEIAACIRKDMGSYREKMGEIKDQLEPWIEFVNPYQRARSAVTCLLKELDGLNLNPCEDTFGDMTSHADMGSAESKWNELTARYARGIGLSFGVRVMLPVMAEAFINMVLYAMMRPDIKHDTRLRNNVLRQHIDVRIKSLHLNCVGFEKPVDYDSDPCIQYKGLVKTRNDLLHGNMTIDHLKFSEVFFLGTIPIFQEYGNMWDRTIGVQLKAVGLEEVHREFHIIENLIFYIYDCMGSDYRSSMELFAKKGTLGIRKDTGRLGVLFPDHLADFRVVVPENIRES